MNHSPQLDLVRLQDSAEERRACIAAVNDYCARTGLNPVDFGRRAGYAMSTFRMFLSDQYQNVSGNSAHIVRACREYMQAHPIAPIREVAGELFETSNVRIIRETFRKLLLRPRVAMIYAPPGSQKTFTFQTEIRAINLEEQAKGDEGCRAFYVYVPQNVRPTRLFKRIAVACGTPSTGDIDRIIANLRHEFSRRRVVLVLDEMQHASLECMDAVRELVDNEPFFSLILGGSHDLFLKLERAALSMEQLNSRIVQRLRLPGCTEQEARGIVEREIGHILAASSASEAKRKQAVDKLIAKATVVDAYVAVPQGQAPATYLNIRTLCNALDDLRMQHEETAAQKVSAA